MSRDEMPAQPAESSTSWGERLRGTGIRRAATSALAAVVFAAVAPAIANAAGADVPNPVVVALRGSSRAVAQAFGAADPAGCDEVVVEPTDTASTDAGGTDGAGTEGGTEGGTDGAAGTTQDPAESPAPAPVTTEPTECEDDEETTAAPESSVSPSPEPAPSAEVEAEEAEDGEHGRIVSTVAHCSPRGKDPLFETLGDDLGNHGAFVRAAAKGETLATPLGSFDLSTQAGADALCAALDGARASLASASPSADDAEKGKGKGKGKAKRSKRGKRAADEG